MWICFLFFMHPLMKGVQLLHRVAIVDLYARGSEDYPELNRANVVASFLEVPHKPIFHTVDCSFDRATFLRYLKAANACDARFFQ
jgi:hypothetical protein